MNTTAQQNDFLGWKILPARLDATQAAWYLGFEPHEIPILIAGNLLKPLGKPARNCTKSQLKPMLTRSFTFRADH